MRVRPEDVWCAWVWAWSEATNIATRENGGDKGKVKPTSCERKGSDADARAGRASPGDVIDLIDVEFNTAHAYSERLINKRWRVVTRIFL